VQLSPRGSHNNAGHRISNQEQEQDQTHTHQHRNGPTDTHKHPQAHTNTPTDRQSIAMAWTVADCKKRKWGNHKFTQICKCLGPGLCVSLCKCKTLPPIQLPPPTQPDFQPTPASNNNKQTELSSEGNKHRKEKSWMILQVSMAIVP